MVKFNDMKHFRASLEMKLTQLLCSFIMWVILNSSAKFVRSKHNHCMRYFLALEETEILRVHVSIAVT